ncbi:C40 family peptidase [Cohnella hongkongensis]|uniref:C40 family peptidase n=1 Tax=Cohnella hongkongensis TaxID=178337 RepID=A0ABV9FJL7_9BACL
MKYPFATNNVTKAMLGATLGLTIVFSAGTMFAGGHTALAATGAVQAADSATRSIADDVIATGEKFIGVRYLYGAESNRTDAFDCSSFTQYVFNQNGISIPRSSRQQSEVGEYVPKSQLQPGDLIFSDTNRDGVINHVSLYVGDGKILHTYRVGIGVTISDFEGSTWDKTYVTARRVIPADAASDGGQSRTDSGSEGVAETPDDNGEGAGQAGTGYADNGGSDRNDRNADKRLWAGLMGLVD